MSAKFWGWAGAGILVMSLAWSWLGLAVSEEYTEQGKALAAGTTMEGFAALVGGVPLVVAHVVGLAVLLLLGWRECRARGIVVGTAAVIGASLVGLGLAQILFEGQVFGVVEEFVP